MAAPHQHNEANQASFVYHNTAVPTSARLIFIFDIVIYGTSTRLADGIGFVLFADDFRTPMAGGYEYLIGAQTLANLSTTRVNSRAGATVHNVRITIPTDETITVEMKNNSTDNWTTLIDCFDPNIDFPDTLRLGFTGATGASFAYHEIRHFQVTSAASYTVIPEPGTIALAATMLLPCLLLRRRHPQITISTP